MNGHLSLVISCYCLSFVTVTNQLLLCVTLHEASTSGFAVVPYIRGAVQPIKQTQASLMILIKIDQKPLLNTGHIFPMPKDNVPKVKRTDYDSVFSVPCKDANTFVSGKLNVSLKEHQKNQLFRNIIATSTIQFGGIIPELFPTPTPFFRSLAHELR